MIKRSRTSCVAHPQKSRSYRIYLSGVKLVEVASIIDEDSTLHGFFREWVISYAVVGEIVEDFEGEEVAGRGNVDVPGEYGAIDDVDVFCVSSC